MADESPKGESKDLVSKTTAGAKDIAKAAKRRYIWAGIFVLLIVVLALKYSAVIKAQLAKILPTNVAKWAGVAAVFVAVSLVSMHAFAATCCAVAPDYSLTHLLSILGGGLALGTTAFFAPDIREAKNDLGGKVVNFDYDSPTLGKPKCDFHVDGQVNVDKKGRPLCALDEVIEVSCTVEQVIGGTTMEDEDLARIFKSVKMVEGNYLGTIQDDNVGTGPLLKHVVEFIGHCFNRGADAPVASIVVPVTPATSIDRAMTRYLSIPHSQRFMNDPYLSAPWLGILDKMTVSIELGEADCLDAVSTGAILKGISSVRVTTPFVAGAHWMQPLVAQYIFEQPAGNTETHTLRKFGQKNAEGTEPTDYLFLVSRLTNALSLLGDCSLEKVLQIDCEQLEISRLENVPAFFKARLDGQVAGRSSMGYDNGNFLPGTVPDGMNLAEAKMLNLRQPGIDMRLDSMRQLTKGFELPISYKYGSGGIPSGTGAYVIGSMRKVNATAAKLISRASGGRIPENPDLARTYK